MENDDHWSDPGQHTAHFNEVASQTEPDIDLDTSDDPEQQPVLGLQDGPTPPGFAYGGGLAHGGFDQGVDEEMDFFDPEGYNNENIELTKEFNEVSDSDLSRGRDE